MLKKLPNVVYFSIFVDIRLTKMDWFIFLAVADHFIKNNKQVITIRPIIKVKILEINQKFKRINLLIKDTK